MVLARLEERVAGLTREIQQFAELLKPLDARIHDQDVRLRAVEVGWGKLVGLGLAVAAMSSVVAAVVAKAIT